MKILSILSLFFSFFPYVSFVYTGTDVQPYLLLVNFILFTVLLLKTNFLKKNKVIFLFFIPIFLSFTLILLSENVFSGLRSLYGYLNISISLIVFIYIISTYEKIFLRFISISIYIWFIVGFIQTFILREFLFQILPRNIENLTISNTRGVQSLAAEPTFYGVICIFFILILIAIPKTKLENRKKLIILLLFQIIFFAKSSMAILFLILFLLIYFIINFISIKSSILISISIVSIALLYHSIDLTQYENIRFIKLLKIFISNPIEIAKIDASMNDRVSAIYFSIKGCFENFCLPHFYGDYSKYLIVEVPKSSYFWYITINDRIKSFYGAILFELGFIGFIYFYGISYLIYLRFKKQYKLFIILFIFVNAILFSAIPISLSFIPLYLAVLYTYRERVKKI